MTTLPQKLVCLMDAHPGAATAAGAAAALFAGCAALFIALKQRSESLDDQYRMVLNDRLATEKAGQVGLTILIAAADEALIILRSGEIKAFELSVGMRSPLARRIADRVDSAEAMLQHAFSQTALPSEQIILLDAVRIARHMRELLSNPWAVAGDGIALARSEYIDLKRQAQKWRRYNRRHFADLQPSRPTWWRSQSRWPTGQHTEWR